MTESETREFKKSLSELKDGLISIAAILNKHGAGELLFGVKNDGVAVGLDINEKTLRDVSQATAAHIEPRIYPQVTVKTIRRARCLRIVFSGSHAPYFAYGRAYMRVADEDRQMSAGELEKFILTKNRQALSFDSQPASCKLRDLDAKRIARFVNQAGLSPGKGETGIRNTLEKLDLWKDGAVLQAASLFFAKIPPVQLRCAVFAGTSSATILDQHDFEGDILEMIEEGQKYILKNIRIGMRLDGLRRVDVPEIAPEALREAVINAFCHRDWFDPETVRIAIYADRVEIRNPGALPEGVTIAQLRKGHISRRRNPLIADLLRRVHLVEGWGRGMSLILDKAPQAEFEDIAGIFIARFARPAETPAVKELGEKRGEKEGGKEGGKEGEKLSQNRQRIIDAMRNDPHVTHLMLSEMLEITPANIDRNVKYLKQHGWIRRIGPAKSGHWEVLK